MGKHTHPVVFAVAALVAIAAVVFLVLHYGEKGKTRRSNKGKS
jgi:hypothetical protein